MEKIMQKCNCRPWFINTTSERIAVCGITGNKCFDKELANYHDDIVDLTECDCRDDCTRLNFFVSSYSKPFTDHSATDEDTW